MSADWSGRPTFRPSELFHSAGYIWVVDAIQPVAALFDPGSRELVRLVSWTEMASGLRKPAARRIEVDDQGIWIQYSSDDALGRLGPVGLLFATYSRGADLLCAVPDGAFAQMRLVVGLIGVVRDRARVRVPHFELRLTTDGWCAGSQSSTVPGC